jgi:hypothetical protein
MIEWQIPGQTDYEFLFANGKPQSPDQRVER